MSAATVSQVFHAFNVRRIGDCMAWTNGGAFRFRVDQISGVSADRDALRYTVHVWIHGIQYPVASWTDAALSVDDVIDSLSAKIWTDDRRRQ